jgi:hypothetical protein
MTYNRLLEEYSPAEARNAGEFRFIEWLFLLYEIAAVILILGTLVGVLDITYVWPVLDVVSQNAPAAILLVLLFLHTGVLLVFFVLRRPITLYLALGFLGLMAVYSIVEFFFGNLTGYNVAGLVVSIFWIAYLGSSKRMKLRFLYNGWFSAALRRIYCPRCKKEVILDAEDCGDELTEDERFTALSERITNVEVPADVRVAQIGLLEERFGEKALSFLKEQYEKQETSEFASAKILSALSHALGIGEEKD